LSMAGMLWFTRSAQDLPGVSDPSDWTVRRHLGSRRRKPDCKKPTCNCVRLAPRVAARPRGRSQRCLS